MPLAEGLEELGVPFCGSSNYWRKPDGSWLIRQGSLAEAKKAEAVIVSTGFLYWIRGRGIDEKGQLPDWILNRDLRGRVVGMDFCDGYLSPVTTVWADSFDLILRAHYNSRCAWPPQVRPWAYGLTRRILSSADRNRTEWSQRSGCLFAFGASHGFPHGARKDAEKHLLPILEKRMAVLTRQDNLSSPPAEPADRQLWEQCAGRHSPDFFKRLSCVQICAAFCGELVPALPSCPDFFAGGNRAKLRRSAWAFLSSMTGRSVRLIQGDSWRMWEALASGAVLLHHDMEETGWQLPVPATAFETYLPFGFKRNNNRLLQTLSDIRALQTIAESGRAWAQKHYSPPAVASRFLKLLQSLSEPETSKNFAQ